MNRQPNFWAVIPAAGVGARMQASCPKQYLKLAGKAVIEHSIDSIMSIEGISGVKLCLSPEDDYVTSLPLLGGLVSRVDGGATRAQSVLNGLLSLQEEAADDDWVLVHDAARPCLENDILKTFIQRVEGDSVGGIMAVRAKDTLKQARFENEPKNQSSSIETTRIQTTLIRKTLDRSTIWHAQTPQMFRYRLLIDALSMGIDNGLDITDEASAVEAAGHAAMLVEGSAHNIKITTPDDLAIAEFLLSRSLTKQQ